MKTLVKKRLHPSTSSFSQEEIRQLKPLKTVRESYTAEVTQSIDCSISWIALNRLLLHMFYKPEDKNIGCFYNLTTVAWYKMMAKLTTILCIKMGQEQGPPLGSTKIE